VFTVASVFADYQHEDDAAGLDEDARKAAYARYIARHDAAADGKPDPLPPVPAPVQMRGKRAAVTIG
jgi:hypothetical protein